MKSDMVNRRGSTHLTLVLPVYNEADTIADCLDAVLASSRQLDRIIVVNNNCTDETMQIVEGYATRLSLDIISENRQGVRFARTTGWRHALNDESDGWVFNIDADTQIESDFVEELVNRCGNSGTDGASCRFLVRGLSQPLVWSARLPLLMMGNISAWAMNLVVVDYHKLIGLGWPLFGSCSVVSKSALTQVIDVLQQRCHDYDVHEDLALSFALKQKGFKTVIHRGELASIANRRVVSVEPAWQRLRSWPLTLSVYGYRFRSLITWIIVGFSISAVALLQMAAF